MYTVHWDSKFMSAETHWLDDTNQNYWIFLSLGIFNSFVQSSFTIGIMALSVLINM